MIKKNFIKLFILLFFLSGWGYSPIFSKKKINFSVYEISASGNNKLNNIINSRLNNYKDPDNPKQFSLNMTTNLNKEIISRDTKGNPKTYRIILKSDILIKDLNGSVRNKLFSKSIDYNNKVINLN